MLENRALRVFGAKPVQCAVGQNALEQHGQLGDGLVTVVFGQLHHAVLNNVQRRFIRCERGKPTA
jgi:hypothetical protein